MELFNLIKERFFTISGIEACPNIEGVKIKDDGTLLLGCLAGPSQEISNLFHEMGHLIICPKKRIGKLSWGLHYTNVVEIPGYPIFSEPLTCQDVLLELKVIGWQAVIERELTGDITKALENVEALTWLGGWCYYKYEETRELTYSNQDKAKIEYGKEFIKDFVSKTSFDQFQEEWNKKLQIIEKKALTTA